MKRTLKRVRNALRQPYSIYLLLGIYYKRSLSRNTIPLSLNSGVLEAYSEIGPGVIVAQY